MSSAIGNPTRASGLGVENTPNATQNTLKKIAKIAAQCLIFYTTAQVLCNINPYPESLPFNVGLIVLGGIFIAVGVLCARNHASKPSDILKGAGALGQKITATYIENHAKQQRTEFYNNDSEKGIKRGMVPDKLASWDVAYPEYAPISFTDKTVYNPETGVSAPWAAPNNRAEAWSHTYDCYQDCILVEDPITKEWYPKNPLGRTGIEGRGLLGNWGPNEAVDMCMTRVVEGRLQVALGLRIHDPNPSWAIVGGGMRDKMVDSTGNFIMETTPSGHQRVKLEHASVAGKRELFEEGVNLKKIEPSELEEKYSAAIQLLNGTYLSTELAGAPIFSESEKGDLSQAAQTLKIKSQKDISDLSDDMQDKICMHMAVQRAIFSKFIESGLAPKIWKGVVVDPRNTDDAWMQSVLINFNFNNLEKVFGPNITKVISLAGGDDIGADIIWADAEAVANRTWIHPLWAENLEATVDLVDHKTGNPISKKIPFHGTFASHHEMIGKLVDRYREAQD